MATTIAERLADAIERWGGSVRGLEKALDGVTGASYANVRRYLAAEREPSIEFLRAAADVLQVRTEWLALESGEMTEDLERTSLASKETAAARLERWRTQRGEREATLFAWSQADEGPGAWAVEAVMRFDDLLDSAGTAVPYLHGIDGESVRLHLLAAAFRHLQNAVMVFVPRADAIVQAKRTEEKTVEWRARYYGEECDLRALFVDPRGSREEYALWADQELRVVASRVRGLGVRLSREERRLASQEMVEVPPEEEGDAEP